MRKTQNILKSTMLSMVVILQIFFYPAAALADTANASTPTAADPVDSSSLSAESTAVKTPSAPSGDPAVVPPLASPDENKTTPPASTVVTPSPVGPQQPTGPTGPVGPQKPVGPTAPTGADSTTYHQNPQTGLWENDYYTWNPATNQAKLKTSEPYVYNPLTQAWDTTEWVYKPELGRFDSVTVSVKSPPPKAIISNVASVRNTGPSSNNTINLGGNQTANIGMTYDSYIRNRIGSQAQSGDANIQGNTIAGSATTGDAQSIANVLNLLQSSWGSLGSDDISTFVANIDGNVVGDLYIDPSQIAKGTGNSKIDVNIAKSQQISNDIDLRANSGNANVANNTSSGDATSGDARAVVNLLNLINSAINTKKSFVGVLNINGDLEGDILLPPGLLESIIASSGPNSNNTIDNQNSRNLNVNADSKHGIVNNITSDASTGNATVDGNTSAGNATTGSAINNITLLNLTGTHVVAKDAVLVFVNVFGKWVGLIMNAPAGTNAVAATGPNSNNTISSTNKNDANINASENSQINNKVKVAARSGDATLKGNTSAGNVRTGNASTGANILNLIDSSFDVSDWFGVLFINVFGSWRGSFGVNTPYGNAAATSSSGATSPQAATSGSPTAPQSAGTFTFVPAASTGNNGSTSGHVAGAVTSTDSNIGLPLGAVSMNQGSTPNTSPNADNSIVRSLNPVAHPSWTLTIVGFSAALTLLGTERFLAAFRHRRI